MRFFALAAALSLAALLAGSFAAPAAAGPYWYSGSGPSSGWM